MLALLVLLPVLLVPAPASAQANVTGQWQVLPYNMLINPIHVAMLPTGRILVVSGTENDPTNTISKAAVLDLNAGTVDVQVIPWDLFCNAMSHLPDGRLLITGGNKQYNPFRGIRTTTIFDPATEKFIQVQDMAEGRWYPSNTLLADGRTITFSGWLEFSGGTNTAVEFYSVPGGWGSEFFAPFFPALYPWMHLLPNGKVFVSGAKRTSELFDPATQTWTPMATFNYPNDRTYGGSVLLPLSPKNNYAPRIMIFGGDNPSTATAELIDLSQPSPTWQNLPSMVGPRLQQTSTILPNGKVFVAGGSQQDLVASTATLAAEMFDPTSLTWSPAGSAAMPRLYHSVALLLPDGRVWMAGSNPSQGTWEPRMEIWSPPYLFNSDGSLAPRPSLTGAPAKVGYNAPFSVQTPDAASISSVVLMHLGSFTHAFDFDQRLVEMSFTKGSGTLTVTSPPNGNIAPPGPYMLFILNASGVPSVAKMITLATNPTNQPPRGSIDEPAGDVTIQAGQSVTFSGGGTDPDGSVSGYQWIFPGGQPASSTSATPGAVSFPAPGTYVVSLTVTDNQGANDPSPPSRTITVQGTGGPGAPTAYFTSPAPNSTVGGTQIVNMGVQGGTSPYTYALAIDGVQVFSQNTANTTAGYAWDTTQYGNFGHSLTLTLTDGAGQTSTATLTVSVDNNGGTQAPFTAGLSSPTAGETVTGNVAVNVWRDGNGTSPYVFTISAQGTVLDSTTSTSNHVTLNWDTTRTPNGPATLVATITDSTNASASTGVNVTVSNAGGGSAPVASFTSPAAGATVGGTVSIGMAVSGGTPSYTYRLTIDGTVVSVQTLTTATATFTWDTTTYGNASHTLGLTVTDANNQSSTASRTVTVSNGGGGGGTAPAASFTSPANGATVSGTEQVGLAVSGGTANYTYVLTIDGTQVFTQTTSATSTAFPWDTTTATDGAHTLALTVTDGQSRTSTVSETVTVQNGGGSASFEVGLTSPSPGATVSGTIAVNVWLGGSGTAPYTYTISANGVTLDSAVCSCGHVTLAWNTLQTPNGQQTMTATITDAAGQRAFTTVTVTVQNAGNTNTPVASFTSPAAGATVSGAVGVGMAVTGGTASYTYRLSIDGTQVFQTTTAASTATFTWDTTTAANGNHTLSLTVTDANSVTSAAATETVTVSNGGTPNPPVASFTSPADGATVSGTQQVGLAVSGGTAPYAYALAIDGTGVFQQTTSATSTAYTWDTTTAASGGHTLSLTVTDTNGQTSTATRSVTVSNGTPAPFTAGLTSPSPGSTVSGTVAVNVWLGGSGTPPYTYAISANGLTLDTAACSCGHVTLAWDTTRTPNGQQTLTATITDAAGLSASTTVTVTVQNAGAGPAPLVASMSSPADGATVSGTVSVGMGVSGGTPSYAYRLTLDGTVVFQQTTTAASQSFSWNTTATADGQHTLVFTVMDAASQTSSVTRTVTVQNASGGGGPAPFEVGLTSPSPGATVSGTIAVNVWLGGSGTAPYTYAISAAGVTLDSAVSSGSHVTLAWDTTRTPNGPQTMTATITDAANRTASTTVNVTVQNP